MDFDALCQSIPEKPIKNPARFLGHEVKIVEHYYPVDYPTLQRALADLQRGRKVRCLGRGPDAQWEHIKG